MRVSKTTKLIVLEIAFWFGAGLCLVGTLAFYWVAVKVIKHAWG